jgi:hypothetical protein
MSTTTDEGTAHISGRFNAVIAAIDAVNRADPNSIELDGEQLPVEWLYAQRMTRALTAFCSTPSEALRIAAHGQHIERWILPRTDFPQGRVGYLKWRTTLKHHHADRVGGIMLANGYDDDEIARVGALLRKESLKSNPETQALEDVICLVFLEHYASAFAASHDEDKIVSIIAKTWRKMSPAGHDAAMTLDLPPKLKQLVGRALAD